MLYSELKTMALINTMFMLTSLMSKKKKMNKNKTSKNTTFECGFMNLTLARKPFSMKFFLMATLFLIFDIEIRIMPMYSTKLTNMKEWMILWSMTMMILLLWLEFKNNILEWSKSGE